MSIHSANERTYDTFGRWRTHTYAHSGEAGVVDETLYIVGSETVDGSIRLRFDVPNDDVAFMESRASGVWNDTGIRFASSSVKIGRDMTLSAIAGFLETDNPSQTAGHDRSFIPHIIFNENGTKDEPPHTPILQAFETFVVFSGAVSEIVSTTIGQAYGVIPARIVEDSIHEVGTVGSSEPVTVSFYTGNDNTGTLFNRRILPANALVADTTLTINYDEDLGFDANVPIFMEFTSDASFSLKTDSGGDILTTHTGHELDERDILIDDLIIKEDAGLVFANDASLVFKNQFPALGT